jgi:hypothetical protein
LADAIGRWDAARVTAGAACAALALGALAGCAGDASIVGVWKSDAARTVAAMRATPGIPDERRRALERDYYGHLVLEYRPETVRAYFDDGHYDSGERPYRVISANRRSVVTSEWNELLKAFEQTTTYRDGDCIYGLAAEFGFREYFCPFEP